ncbi:GxxExxY protein [Neorhodopirellula lusitana]|uniref:GxxExxY protein n=1 Tax=Neorhodopirellula lusitana TaxID=445327 RepID=A0ABY1QG46_9BACT|nr:GxxExxY protein [Neorhodopirellula lusitana]SMP67333.1 GxxExxY protein [Neorhodopirellula lusitana]
MSDGLTEKIIGAAIEVHRLLGPGLLESIYEEALCYELQLHGVACERQKDPSTQSAASLCDLRVLCGKIAPAPPRRCQRQNSQRMKSGNGTR